MPKIDGTELYLVGGCVRDELLNKPIKDRDYVVVTKMNYKELVKKINSMPRSKVFVEKPEFLTIRARINREVIDLAFPRSDHNYTDGRRPDEVKMVSTLKEDASRRDFTINSMYKDENGNIIDYFGGQKDLSSRIIRTVGSPCERFQEDYLRILRAVRFSITLGFSIERETLNAMKNRAIGLNNISMERIREELNKALKVDPIQTIEYIKMLNLAGILKAKGLHFELSAKEV